MTQKMKTLKSCPFESPAFGDICTGATGGISEPAQLRALALHIHPSATCPGRDRAVGGPTAGVGGSLGRSLASYGEARSHHRKQRSCSRELGAALRPTSLRQRRLRPLGSWFWFCFGIKVPFEATQTRISVGHVPSPRGELWWRHVRPGWRLPAFCTALGVLL